MLFRRDIFVSKLRISCSEMVKLPCVLNTSLKQRCQNLLTGLTSVPNRTSNKLESPSIVSQETCETFGNSCNS